MKNIKKNVIIGFVAIATLISIRATEDDFFQISKNLDIFASVYRELNLHYVDEIQPGELMKTGIDAMLNSLDPYTNFIPESQIEEYKFMTTGQYGGIGALIRKKGDYIILSDVYEGYPAQKNGLWPGDKLIEIDGQSVVGKNTEDISSFLKGEPTSTVKILVERGDGDSAKRFTKSVVRQEIKVKDVPYFGMIDDKTGYIILNSFSPTASTEFERAFKSLTDEKGMKQLVFDLRGNGGGLLMESVNIVNNFVKRGTPVVETRGKVQVNNQVYKALNKPLDLDMPVAVLINGGSASASEIVAGSLQDLDRGVIIGQRSFGKGLVQNSKPISYNAQLKITVAKYYIPSGRCIQKIDYSHKSENGKASSVPDSLISTYESLVYKRSLMDGKGINPDLEIKPRSLSAVSKTLLIKDYIFDYATIYRSQHNEIAGPNEFTLSADEYEGFIEYLSDKDYSYETNTEKLLSELKNQAEKEKYFDQAESEYKELVAKMKMNKEDDLRKFSDEIKELLEYEIISRYYYDNGRISSSLDRDPVVLAAVATLNDSTKYHSILQGSFKLTEEVEQD